MPIETAAKPKELKDVIIEITAQFYNTTTEKLQTNTGRFIDVETAYRKHICYYMIKNYTFFSYDVISLSFSTSQSTIKFGVNKINDLLSYHRRTIAEVKEIKKLIDNFKQKTGQLPDTH